MRVVNCLVAVILLLTAPAFADESKPPKVAVLDLKAQGVAQDAVKTLTGVLLSGLAEGGGIDMLSKADLGSMLSLEQTKLLLGCLPEDPSCVAEHGQTLGHTILVWGSVGQVGDQVVITIAAVDMQAETTLGRASRTVDAGDGQDMIEATGELAAEIRASLGLASEANWTPIVSLSLRFGGILSGYLGDDVEPSALLAAFELETDIYIIPEVPIYLKVGLTLGGGDNDAYFVPATVGTKYRWIRGWVTPYIGLGLGLEFLDFSDDSGGVFSLHVIAGLEFNPWKRVGFSIDGGFNFSQTFATKDFTQLGGKLHLGVIYRF
jgi:hypothetical protein